MDALGIGVEAHHGVVTEELHDRHRQRSAQYLAHGRV
jgi:hypothetical protein